MDNLEERVVPVAQDFVVKFHDRPAPEVVHAVFGFILHDAVEDIFEELPQVLRALTRLRRVLRQVFQHSPQVQERSPVDVAKICEQQVLLEIIQQSIISL